MIDYYAIPKGYYDLPYEMRIEEIANEKDIEWEEAQKILDNLMAEDPYYLDECIRNWNTDMEW
jgi:DNA-directed RNA polymerase specialized sigma subunit